MNSVILRIEIYIEENDPESLADIILANTDLDNWMIIRE